MFQKKQKVEFYEADDYFYQQQLNYNSNYYDSYGSTADNTERKKSRKWVFFLVLGYVVFVMLGALSTPYYTEMDGTKKAQILNIVMLEAKSDYYELKNAYISLKSIITDIMEFDKEKNDLKKATAFSEFLVVIDKDIIKAKAITVDAKYDVLREKIMSIYNSTAIYLQKIKLYITNGDNESYKQALSWKATMLMDFNRLHAAMSEFAAIVKVEDPLFEDPSAVFFVSENAVSTSQPEPTPGTKE